MSGLYAIVDPSLCEGRDPLRVADAILAGGCARLQLRAKTASDRARLELGRALAARCEAAGVPFVMNDRADLTLLTGAAGLHLGQDDLPVEDARRVLGGRAIEIGRSTHDLAQARAAAAEGADLVAFGPVFDTRSKEAPDPTVGLARLKEVCRQLDRPVVAIGGIDVARAPAVRAAGARFGAAISALCAADDPEAAARAMHEALR